MVLIVHYNNDDKTIPIYQQITVITVTTRIIIAIKNTSEFVSPDITWEKKY